MQLILKPWPLLVLAASTGAGPEPRPERKEQPLASGAPSSRGSGRAPRGGRRVLTELEDRALVERAAEGDSLAFGELYRRYVKDVYRFVWLRVGEQGLAEDLSQDVFLSAYKAMPRFEWQGHFRPWLLRCAQHRIANHWRTRGRRPVTTDWPEDSDETDAPPPRQLASEADPTEGTQVALDTEEALRAMRRLSDLQQQTLVLRFGMELTMAETADVMQRSLSAIKSLQFSGLEKLRQVLSQGEGQR